MNKDKDDKNKEKNNFLKNNKKNKAIKKNTLLTFECMKPFERHPSVTRLIESKDNHSAEKNNNFKVEINYSDNNSNNNDNNKNNNNNKNHERSKSTFEFRVHTIEEKIYQNEVFYTPNENPNKISNHKTSKNLLSINPKLNKFNEKEFNFDKEITKDIQNGEDSENIINKISNFAFLKK